VGLLEKDLIGLASSLGGVEPALKARHGRLELFFLLFKALRLGLLLPGLVEVGWVHGRIALRVGVGFRDLRLEGLDVLLHALQLQTQRSGLERTRTATETSGADDEGRFFRRGRCLDKLCHTANR